MDDLPRCVCALHHGGESKHPRQVVCRAPCRGGYPIGLDRQEAPLECWAFHLLLAWGRAPLPCFPGVRAECGAEAGVLPPGCVGLPETHRGWGRDDDPPRNTILTLDEIYDRAVEHRARRSVSTAHPPCPLRLVDNAKRALRRFWGQE